MKLRWLVRFNVVTAKQVVEHAQTYGTSFGAAREILEDRKPPVLQMFVESALFGKEGEWVDVPTEAIERVGGGNDLELPSNTNKT